jgi:hypothetical protein
LTDGQIATSTEGHEMRTTAHTRCCDDDVSWFAASGRSSFTSPDGASTQAVLLCSVSGGPIVVQAAAEKKRKEFQANEKDVHVQCKAWSE